MNLQGSRSCVMGRFEPGALYSRRRVYNKAGSTPLWRISKGISFQSPYSEQVGTGILEVSSLIASVNKSSDAEEQ